jgi:hypothetical protein
MVLPVLLEVGSQGGHAAHAGHAGATGMSAAGAGVAGAAAGAAGQAEHLAPLVAGLPPGQLVGLMATGVHTVGYLLVTALLALVVYHKLGVRLLRTHWINLDLIWAVALILTALATPLI